MNQQHANLHAELHADLVRILSELVPVLDCDDLKTLVFGCGLTIDDFYVSQLPPTTAKETNLAANPF